MSKSLKQVTIIIFSLGATIAIWAIAWLLYDKMEIWRTFTNTTYQNIIYAAIGTEIAISMIAAAQTKQSLTSLDKKQLKKIFKKEIAKVNPKIEEQDSKIKELTEKVADLKAAIKMAPKTTTEAKA